MPKIFGILAHPAGHSLSPTIMNAAFRKLKIDASYGFFDIAPSKLKDFFVNEVRAKKINGLSVSIPHKTGVIKFLDELDESAKKIGAVNTIFWRDEKLVGVNTDAFGFLNSFQKSIDNKKVIVLGGGGAAHAIVTTLLAKNCEVVVLTRSNSKMNFNHSNLKFDTLANLENYTPEILVNATPLGMHGKFEGKSIVDSSWLVQNRPLVFDLVYNPRETQLLKIARKNGCETIEGLEMLVNQAVAQFYFFTNRRVEKNILWEALKEK